MCSLSAFLLNEPAGAQYRNEESGSVWAELGAAAVTGSLDPGVGEGELDCARRLGERVASLAKRLKSPDATSARAEESGFPVQPIGHKSLK
jgi:hypothetical protein